MLQAARGPVPSLAEAVAGGPIRGSWWSHPKGREIFRAASVVCESPDVLVCKLIEGKVTYVHRRLWPALVRLAGGFPRARLAKVWNEHTATGAHRSRRLAVPRLGAARGGETGAGAPAGGGAKDAEAAPRTGAEAATFRIEDGRGRALDASRGGQGARRALRRAGAASDRRPVRARAVGQRRLPRLPAATARGLRAAAKRAIGTSPKAILRATRAALEKVTSKGILKSTFAVKLRECARIAPPTSAAT